VKQIQHAMNSCNRRFKAAIPVDEKASISFNTAILSKACDSLNFKSLPANEL